MKKTLITTGLIIAAALVALFIFDRMTSRDNTEAMFAEVSRGKFDVVVSVTGELVAENSIEIKGPAFGQGNDVRSTNVRITDLIPEGTEVKKGDYVGSLDKTELDNEVKSIRERITEMEQQLETQILDTAVQLTNIRDQITNQLHTIEEAEIKARNSKFESPMTQREAEIDLEKARMVMDQLKRSYELKKAQTRVNIGNRKMFLNRINRRLADYENTLREFTITAPSDGMVIYYKTRLGTKRKVGQTINVVDRTVATIPDLRSMLSRVYVSEVEINKVKPGMPVSITIDAFPNKSYTGTVLVVGNIGEKLPNSDSKVFEVTIKIAGTDMDMRPSMTTNNKILIKSHEDVNYIPLECVHTGTDSIPVVYTKSGIRQPVILGDANEKYVIIDDVLKPGTPIHVEIPEEAKNFKTSK